MIIYKIKIRNKNVIKQSVILMTENFESYEGTECDGSDPFSENESEIGTKLFMYTFHFSETDYASTLYPAFITNEKL